MLEYHLTPKTKTPADGERLWKHDWWWRYNTTQGRYEPEGDVWRLDGGYLTCNTPTAASAYRPMASYSSGPIMQLRGGYMGRGIGGVRGGAGGACAGGT